MRNSTSSSCFSVTVNLRTLIPKPDELRDSARSNNKTQCNTKSPENKPINQTKYATE